MNDFIPIFPLELVVYPGDDLNLHIFEPRYQELIRDCAKTQAPFGIPTVLERRIGTLGTAVRLREIANVQADGQMDIRTRGLKVFRIVRLVKPYPGKLYSGAEVEQLTGESEGDATMMRAVLAGVKQLHGCLNVEKKFPKPAAELTSYDLAHLAGLTLKQEYEVLGLPDERQRQEYLQRHLDQILPVVAEMAAWKAKIQLNGHFKNLPGFEL